MKDNNLLIFVLTALLDFTVGLITIEVLAMIFIKSLELQSIIIICVIIPIIFIIELLINKLKNDEELK